MKIVKLIIALLICLCLTGCNDIEVTPSIESQSIEYSDFKLIVDKKTGVIYINNTFDYEGGSPGHVYTPYYSKNGKLCRWVDGKVVEINEDNN